MARTKQASPLKREVSSEYIQPSTRPGYPSQSPRRTSYITDEADTLSKFNGKSDTSEPLLKLPSNTPPKEAGITELLFCIGGIYASL
jgi:hypothetical protein